MSVDRVAEIRNGVSHLETQLALWAVRDETAAWETTPAVARSGGRTAVRTIDDVVAALHRLRSELVAEIVEYEAEHGPFRGAVVDLPADESPSPWNDSGSGPGWPAGDPKPGEDG